MHAGMKATWQQTYDFAGYGFRVVTDVEAAGHVVHDLLEPYEAPVNGKAPTYRMLRVPNHRHRFTLHRDQECLLDESRAYAGSLVDFLISDMTKRAIEIQKDYLVIHASVASWMGNAVVMPAPADSGKTTTVAGLVRAGFDYLSDEAALISLQTGRVDPFSRPLAMDASSVRLIRGLGSDLPDRYHEIMRRQEYYVPCEFLRRDSRGTACAVRYVVAPTYSGGSVTELVPMSRAEAASLLLEQCFNFEELGKKALLVIADVVRGARCYRLQIGDLDDAVAKLKEIATSDL